MPPTAPDPELVGIFETEVSESIDVIHDHLLHIEQGASDAGTRLEDVLRLAHDLKGSARVVGYELVAHLAHALEGHLLPWRQAAPQPGQIDTALRATDALRELALDADDAALQSGVRALIDELHGSPASEAAPRAPAAAPAPLPAQTVVPVAAVPSAPPAQPPTRPAAPTPGETLRVPRSHVDKVADDVAVMLHDTQSAQVRVHELKRSLDAVRAVQLPRSNAPAREVTRALGTLRALLADVVAACNRAQDTLNQFDVHARNLDDDTRKLCLVPVKPLLQHLDSVAREAARSLGRQLRVELEGRDELVDEALIEALKGPLTHAVRNAVDHGIEPPAERLAARKAPNGTLRLSVTRAGDRLRLTIADDGRGIDRAAVRRKLGPSAAGLDDQALLHALMRSGRSTREQVTEISGRGFGMGALVMVAERLRGDVEIDSPPGAGTTIVLAVPLRLSTLDGLVVEAGGNRFVLPLSALAGVTSDGPRGVPALFTLLGLSGDPGQPTHVVRLHGRDHAVSVAVDHVHDRLEVVRRPTGVHLGRVPFVDGATILPHGEPALILDPREIADACDAAAARAAAPATSGPATLAPAGTADSTSRSAGTRRRILLADDSATLRSKLFHDLSQAGFDVVLAEDGQRALDQLAAISCDALVSDVQMPRMDGLQLLERCAGRLPVVLMTSFPEPAGEARARELGALAYLVKDQSLGERVITLLNQTLTRCKDTRQ